MCLFLILKKLLSNDGYNVIVEGVNLDKGDAVGRNSDVIAELVEEIMWNTE